MKSAVHVHSELINHQMEHESSMNMYIDKEMLNSVAFSDNHYRASLKKGQDSEGWRSTWNDLKFYLWPKVVVLRDIVYM